MDRGMQALEWGIGGAESVEIAKYFSNWQH